MESNKPNDFREIETDTEKSQMEEDKKPSMLSELISWFKTVLLVIILVLIVQNFIIINATVPTGSMAKTIEPGDKLITSRLTYLFSSPKRGDVIVFKFPDDEKQKFTKRIIGLPGEKVEIKDGKVYINDSPNPLNEPYVNGTVTGDYGPYNVPKDCYFMLGDNRGDSLDSRFWENTYLKRNKILGEIKFKYYPKFEWMDKDVKY